MGNDNIQRKYKDLDGFTVKPFDKTKLTTLTSLVINEMIVDKISYSHNLSIFHPNNTKTFFEIPLNKNYKNANYDLIDNLKYINSSLSAFEEPDDRSNTIYINEKNKENMKNILNFEIFSNYTNTNENKFDNKQKNNNKNNRIHEREESNESNGDKNILNLSREIEDSIKNDFNLNKINIEEEKGNNSENANFTFKNVKVIKLRKEESIGSSNKKSNSPKKVTFQVTDNKNNESDKNSTNSLNSNSHKKRINDNKTIYIQLKSNNSKKSPDRSNNSKLSPKSKTERNDNLDKLMIEVSNIKKNLNLENEDEKINQTYGDAYNDPSIMELSQQIESQKGSLQIGSEPPTKVKKIVIPKYLLNEEKKTVKKCKSPIAKSNVKKFSSPNKTEEFNKIVLQRRNKKSNSKDEKINNNKKINETKDNKSPLKTNKLVVIKNKPKDSNKLLYVSPKINERSPKKEKNNMNIQINDKVSNNNSQKDSERQSNKISNHEENDSKSGKQDESFSFMKENNDIFTVVDNFTIERAGKSDKIVIQNSNPVKKIQLNKTDQKKDDSDDVVRFSFRPSFKK